MKKLLGITLCLFAFIVSGCSQETVITPEKTPAAVMTYLHQHFPNQKILQIIEDRDGLELDYDIILSQNITIELTKTGQLKSAKSQTKIPESVIPSEILKYVKANYATNYLVSIDIDQRDQEVKLDNGLELVFNKNGAFLRLDD